MWSDGILVPPPALDQHLGFAMYAEDLAVEQFVPELRVGSSHSNRSPRDSFRSITRSSRQSSASHCRTALAANSGPLSERMCSGGPCSTNWSARQCSTSSDRRATPSHHDRQAAPGKLVDDAQHAETPCCPASVLDEASVATRHGWPVSLQPHTRPVVEPQTAPFRLLPSALLAPSVARSARPA